MEQVVSQPTRKDKIPDLVLTNYPAIIEKKTDTMTPLEQADHTNVYIECSLQKKMPNQA